MGANLNGGGQCLRFVFIGWNVLVLLIGAAALGVGIWQVVENNDYEELTGQEAASGAILSIVAGIIAIGVALLGIVGAIGLWRPLLVIYAIIVAIIVLFELISGILGFVYRDELEDNVSDNAIDAIEDYFNESDARSIIDTIQNDFECCGWNNFSDYIDTDQLMMGGFYPESCECDDDDDDGSGSGSGNNECVFVSAPNGTQLVYNEGCRDSVVDFLEAYQLAVGAVGISFAVIQIVVIMIALGLCFCVHKARGEYTTV